jgi:hypothetical protein
MSQHHILTPTEHQHLRIHIGHGAAFGDKVMACLAVPLEFRRLANDYPILFRFDPATRSFSALALMGFEPEENLFLDHTNWHAGAKPLALAIQPFLVGRSSNPDAPGQVHIDLDHPRIARGEDGVRLFDELGQPTPFLEQAVAKLSELDAGYRASADFFESLDRYELLEPCSFDVPGVGGGDHRLVGYHIINEDKLANLEPSALIELHSSGHLMQIFMAVASLGNIAKLARRRGELHHV